MFKYRPVRRLPTFDWDWDTFLDYLIDGLKGVGVVILGMAVLFVVGTLWLMITFLGGAVGSFVGWSIVVVLLIAVVYATVRTILEDR